MGRRCRLRGCHLSGASRVPSRSDGSMFAGEIGVENWGSEGKSRSGVEQRGFGRGQDYDSRRSLLRYSSYPLLSSHLANIYPSYTGLVGIRARTHSSQPLRTAHTRVGLPNSTRPAWPVGRLLLWAWACNMVVAWFRVVVPMVVAPLPS